MNLDQQKRPADALPLHQKVLDIYRKVLGEDHPDTATAYHNLAFSLARQGRYADALPLYQKSLEVRRKVLGEDHPDTGLAYHNLADDLARQGRYADALPPSQKALDIRRKTLGEDHPETALAYNNLAYALQALGRTAEAITSWTAASDGFERGRRALSRSGLGRSQAVRYDPQPALAAALASQGQVREAWRRWESSLGQGLLDDLSARQLRPLTPAQRTQEERLRRQIQQFDEQIGDLTENRVPSAQTQVVLDRLRRQRDTLNGRLLELDQAFEAQYGAFGGKRTSLEAIQATLPPDAALVGWVDVKDQQRTVSLHWACLVRARGGSDLDSGPGKWGGWSLDGSG